MELSSSSFYSNAKVENIPLYKEKLDYYDLKNNYGGTERGSASCQYFWGITLIILGIILTACAVYSTIVTINTSDNGSQFGYGMLTAVIIIGDLFALLPGAWLYSDGKDTFDKIKKNEIEIKATTLSAEQLVKDLLVRQSLTKENAIQLILCDSKSLSKEELCEITKEALKQKTNQNTVTGNNLLCACLQELLEYKNDENCVELVHRIINVVHVDMWSFVGKRIIDLLTNEEILDILISYKNIQEFFALTIFTISEDQFTWVLNELNKKRGAGRQWTDRDQQIVYVGAERAKIKTLVDAATLSLSQHNSQVLQKRFAVRMVEKSYTLALNFLGCIDFARQSDLVCEWFSSLSKSENDPEERWLKIYPIDNDLKKVIYSAIRYSNNQKCIEEMERIMDSPFRHPSDKEFYEVTILHDEL